MPRRTGSAGIFAISIALMVYHTDAADSVTLSELVCDSQIYDIKDGDSLLIKWDGTELPKYCRLGFEAPDTSSWTCFNIEKFRLYNCKFYIEIYKNFEKYSSKRYDCSSTDIDDEYCLQSQKITYLKFTYNHTGIASFSPHVRLSVSVQHKEADAVASPEVSEITRNILAIGVAIGFIVCFVAVKKREHLKNCKEYMECIACLPCALCELICTACRSLKNRCRDCVTSVDIDCSQPLVCCQPRSQEPNARDAPTPTVHSQTTEFGNYVADFDDITTEESAHPSAAPTDNGWAPPPYVAPPPDESVPEAPPPSYYDVITGSVSVSKA
ncbi:uncharacterized protein LOC117330863 isoform X4 [Pecten maximus]|uniref:uncharacterized protein LOC117330863 isoform X4 n=1 Tax=Pecten maximus TaxID=6579 RepID=UPI001458AD3A|nr:uncharacterized protein LOC117330863 isoform X4 [Pecten maximus]